LLALSWLAVMAVLELLPWAVTVLLAVQVLLSVIELELELGD